MTKIVSTKMSLMAYYRMLLMVLLILSNIVAIIQQTEACKCGGASIESFFDEAESVFMGNITQVENIIIDNPQQQQPSSSENQFVPPPPVLITLNIQQSWKMGRETTTSTKNTIRVLTNSESAACGYCQFLEDCAMESPIGKEFLVFTTSSIEACDVDDKDEGDLTQTNYCEYSNEWVHSCGGTKMVDDPISGGVSEQDINVLNALTSGNNSAKNNSAGSSYQWCWGCCYYFPLMVSVVLLSLL